MIRLILAEMRLSVFADLRFLRQAHFGMPSSSGTLEHTVETNAWRFLACISI